MTHYREIFNLGSEQEACYRFGVHRRSVVLSEEQYEVLRASAYLSGQRTGALMRAILDEKIEQLGRREDVQRLVKIQRLERSKLKAV